MATLMPNGKYRVQFDWWPKEVDTGEAIKEQLALPTMAAVVREAMKLLAAMVAGNETIAAPTTADGIVTIYNLVKQ